MEYEYKRNHVPAFGSWDCNDDLPFTQCFETARQAGLLRYSYSEDRDLYVTGDLYDNNVVTPAMIVVPRRAGKAGGGDKKDAWVVCDYEYDYNFNYDCHVKEPPSPVSVATPPPPSPPTQIRRRHVKPKAVDEDLYRISPELLRAKAKKASVAVDCMGHECSDRGQRTYCLFSLFGALTFFLQKPMLCSLLCLVWSRVSTCREVVRDRGWTTIPADAVYS
ncbi:hypothetical protein Tco_0521832 [Tanacetum coccineum]